MTRLVTDSYIGWRIVRAEYVRRLRRLRGSRPKLALGALLALLNLPVAVILVQWIHGVGQASRSGLAYPAVAAGRNAILPMVLTVTVISGLGLASELSDEKGDPLLLRTVPNRAYLIGEVLQEFLGLVGVYLLPTVVLGAAFAIGAGTPLALVPLVLAVVPPLVLGFLLGHVLAYAFWLGLLALPITVGVRKVLGALTTIVLIVGSLAVGFGLGSGAAEGGIAGSLPTGPPPTPLGWYADLLFVGTPLATPIGDRTVVAASLFLGALPLTVWTLARVAPRFWYATPNSPDTTAASEASAAGPASATIGRQGWLAGSLPLRLAAGYVRRVRRRPDRAIYTLYYLVIASAIGLPGVLPGGNSPIAVTGFALVVLGVWLAAGVFCLNPLGDEGGMLGQLLLSETPARTVIVARLLAGLAVGVPLSLGGLAVIVVTTPAFAGLTGITAGLLVLLLVLASAGSALAIGTAVPQFERSELFQSVDAVVPSNTAMLFHGVLTLVLTGGTLVVPLWAWNTAGPAWGRGIAVVALSALLFGLADGGRRYATTRFASHGQIGTRPGPVVAVYTAAGLALLSFLVGQLVTVALFTVGVGGLTGATRLTAQFLAQYAGFLAVGVGYLYVTRRGLDYLDTGFSVRRHGKWVVGGLAGALVLWLVSTAAISRFGLPATDQSLLRSVAGEPELLSLFLVLTVLVNAPVEELLYRNVIQKSLSESLPTAQAITVTSGLFALAHTPAYFNPDPVATGVSLGVLFLLGTLWGVVYAKTESLVATAAVHGCYNAILVGVVYVTAS